MSEEIMCSYVKCTKKATEAYIFLGMFIVDGNIVKKDCASLCCERHSVYRDPESNRMTIEEYKIWKIHND